MLYKCVEINVSAEALSGSSISRNDQWNCRFQGQPAQAVSSGQHHRVKTAIKPHVSASDCRTAASQVMKKHGYNKRGNRKKSKNTIDDVTQKVRRRFVDSMSLQSTSTSGGCSESPTSTSGAPGFFTLERIMERQIGAAGSVAAALLVTRAGFT